MAAILQLIRPSASAGNPATTTLRAEVEGLRLALALAQEALREERADKEHWRDEAKQLRELLATSKREPEIILAADEIVPPALVPEAIVVDAPALAPVADAELDLASAQSAAPAPRFRWWGRLFA